MPNQTNTLPTGAELQTIQQAAATAQAKADTAQAKADTAQTKADAAQTKADTAATAAANAPTAATTAATTAAVTAMNTARQNDTQANPPRMRASFNTAAPLTLTNAWQLVSFKKTGTYDVDTFPNGGRFDATTNKLIAATAEATDRQYDVEFFFKITAGLVPINDIQLRFVVPAPTPIYFPFPDGDGFTNIGSMLISPFRGTYKQVLYFNSAVRQYGIQLQMRAGADVLIALAINRPVLVDAALSLFPR